jgi:tetratricopeptide (TPR) repeat protein
MIMSKFLVILLLIFMLVIGCGNKEALVKSNEGLEAPALLQKGTEMYNLGNTEEALLAYEVIYSRYPTSREYIGAVIGMARCHNNLGDFERGFDLLYNLIRENMVPSKVPEIFNEMARFYEVNAAFSSEAGISQEADDYKKAIDFYQKAVKYPNSEDIEAKSYAQFRAGELYLKLAQYEDAALAYQATLYKFPNTEWAQMAETRIGELRQAGQTVLSTIKQDQASDKTVSVTDTTKSAMPPEPTLPTDDETIPDSEE